MKRYQLMKRSEPDEVIVCNTSYLPRHIMDACSALRNYGTGDMLVMLHDRVSNEYALIRTPLGDMWSQLEFVIAQICGCENTTVIAVNQYKTARMMVLDVVLSKGTFETGKTYELSGGRLVPKGVTE